MSDDAPKAAEPVEDRKPEPPRKATRTPPRNAMRPPAEEPDT